MKIKLLTSLFLLVLYGHICINADDAMPRTKPENEGISSASVIAFLDSMNAFPGTEIHSVIVARRGNIVAEMWPKPFAAEYPQTLYSCSKTFISAAVGIAVEENRLRIKDRVATFFHEDLPDTISANLAAMTVRDLLVMASGIEPDWSLRDHNDKWVKELLSRPVAEPGKRFKYDSMCTYLLSAILQKVTGMTAFDYVNDCIFKPLGITEAQWEQSPEGYTTGGWGLRLKSESLAKFGTLLMQKGRWNGRQLIPAAWVGEMMKMQIDNSGFGYGYQMWPCEQPGTARADGAFGQYIYVIPDRELVVVVTQCGNFDSARQRGLLWRVLLPGVRDRRLRPDASSRRLARKETSYVLPFAKGRRSDKAMPEYEGKTLTLGKNNYGWKTLTLGMDGSELVVTVGTTDGDKFIIRCGNRRWITTENDATPVYSITARGRFKGVKGPFRVAGSFGWERGQLNVSARYVDWITALDMTLEREADGLRLNMKMNNSTKADVIEINGL